jgi:PKD repeat protein
MKNFIALLSLTLLGLTTFGQQLSKLQPGQNSYPKIATKKFTKFDVFNQQPLGTYEIQGKNPDTAKAKGTLIDKRQLPLDSKGNLLSVDGHKVEFRQPSDTGISNVCYTPRPYITGGPKDASCSYVVPCDNPANRDASSFSTIKYFQVEWHVMWDGGASSNIDQSRIDDLMAELNADFAAYNMIFCANPASFYEDATNYYHDENTEEFSLKATYVTNPTNLINVYVVGDMGPGGYARFPYDPNGGTNANGGIVLNRGNCSVGTHTLAHEMGHTFGLEHTFAGIDERANCSSCYEKVRNVNGSSNTTGVPTPLGGPYTNEGDREGDWCSDTEPHITNTYNCTNYSSAQQACDAFAPTNPPVDNHMSYSFCSSTFTDQQGRRMHCMVDTYLGSWTAYGGGICGAQPPTADFVGTPTTWQAPSNVTFTDQSAPQAIITGWTWTFDVGASGTVTCAGCTGANAQFVGQTPPVVTYPNPGLYTVSLTITSANGNDTETKTDYIEVLAPAGDCDTLTTQWENVGPTVITYGFGGGWLTGVQDPVNSVLPTDPKGVYERYFTPNPGVTPVGAIRVGLGSLRDDDDDMTFQVSVYDDDGFGAPGALLGGTGGISPTLLGVPGVGFYNEYWIPILNAPIPTTGSFHVAVEMFPGDANDTLIVMTSCLGPAGCPVAEGEADASNHIWTTGFGYENLLNVYGADFDVDIIPMLGEYDATPVVTGFTENVVCDTTYVEIFDTVLYTSPSSLTGMTFTFADGTVLNSATDPGSLSRVYTQPGPDTLTIAAINDCGRGDTITVIIPYNFMGTPDADFTKDLGNPICLAAQPITFTANTAGYTDYTWDFGDGTVINGTDIETHTYASTGIYYTNLSVTAPGYQPSDTTFLEDFETGIPVTWATFDNNGSAGNAAVNPPFDGTNATAWLPLDQNGTGDNEAYSTSWNNPATQAADDWLISPLFPVAATNSLAWDAQALDATFNDGYEVYVTTGAQSVAGCQAGTMVFSTGGENSFQTNRVVDLSAYGFTAGNARVCFRNNSTDQFLLAIDNVRVGTTGSGCTYSENKIDYVEIVDCSTPPPVANGTADVVAGCAPQTVNFTGGQSGGDPATSWVWNFGDGNFSTAQNPSHVYALPGTYLVIFEACNSGGCDQNQFNIVISASEDASYSYSSVTECQSGTDMSATITGDAGGTFTSVPAAGISLNASTGLIDVSATTPGTYDITYTTSAGACADAQTIQVTINADQSAAYSYPAANYCQNDTDPVPIITGTGGGTFTSSPAGLSINSGTGTIDVSASTAGTYTVTYTTPGPCPDASNTSITINTVDDASYSYSAAAYCVNDADPTPTITGTGGGTFSSSPAGLSINTSTGVIDVSASTPGAYTVTYTTTGVCPATSNQSVTINALDDASFSYSSATYCQADADPSPTVTGLGGGTFTSTPAGLSINAATGQIDLSASTANTYTITYTTNGTCPNSSNVIITVTTTDDPSFSYSAASYCTNDVDPTPTITGTAGGSFSSTAGLIINTGTGEIDLSASTTGTYTVTYTTSGSCSASSNQSVTINAADDPSFTYSVGTLCQSDSDPSPTITGLAGGTFTAAPAGLSINAGTGVIDLSASTGGSYTITYTTSGPCPNSATFSFTVQESPTYSAIVNPENCSAGDGSINLGAVGGSGAGYLYSIDGGATTQASGTFSGLSAGTYNIYIEDGNGCSVTGTETVNGLGGPTITGINVDVALSCFGDCNGELTVSVTGGTPPYTYAWEDGANNPVGGNSATITGLCADNYTVTVTDAAGGTTSVWAEDFGTDAACANQNQLATAAASVNGSWTQAITAAEGGVPNQWFVSATEAFTGTGNCGDGCIANAALDNQTLHVGSLGVGLCPSGDCGAAYNAGANGETHKRIESPTINLTGETGAVLSFDYMHFGEVGTDAASLYYYDGATWNALAVPLPQTTCCGGPCGSLLAQGQWSPTRYSIALPASADNNPNVRIGFSWDNDANNSGADPSFAVDDIDISVNSTGGGCPAVASMNLTEPTQLSFDNIVTVNPTCNGDTDASITITASGGTGTIDYSNDNGVTFQAGNSFTGLDDGSYDLVLEDDNGCQETTNVVISDPPLLSITNVASTDPTCNGDNDGTIDITATGGTGTIVYSIDNGVTFQGGNTFAGLTAGTYNIVVEDDNGCQATATATLTDPPAVTIDNLSFTDPLCNGDVNGTITITASGGTGGLNYSIDNGVTFQGSGSFTGLSSGGYTIVVEDGSGCQATGTVTLTNPPALTITGITGVDPSCNGGTNGSITINATGGTAPLQYSIDNGVTFQAGNNFTGLSAGTYDIVVEDASGCQTTATATLTDPPAVTIDNITSNDPTCNGLSDGDITIVASGGTGGLNYSIDNGVSFQGTGSFTGLTAATYNVVVEDANGCQATTTVTLTDPAALSISGVIGNDPSCFGLSDGDITINATGGTGTLNYSIDNGVTFQTGNTFGSLGDGTYDIVVEDVNGCQAITTITLTEPAQLTYTVTITDENCGAADGEIDLVASGGDGGPYNYIVSTMGSRLKQMDSLVGSLRTPMIL